MKRLFLLYICLVIVLAQEEKYGPPKPRCRNGKPHPEGAVCGIIPCPPGYSCDRPGSICCKTKQVYKPGFCPVNPNPPEACAAFIPPGSCTGDGSCPGIKKCCIYGCYPECLDPVFQPPIGRCPHRGHDSGKPCPRNPYHSCKSDRDCPKGNLCCLVGCSRSCVRPVY